MFQSRSERFRQFLSRFDDVLGDPEPTPHPHRVPLRWDRERRPGTVPAPPAHCISPTRSTTVPVQRKALR